MLQLTTKCMNKFTYSITIRFIPNNKDYNLCHYLYSVYQMSHNILFLIHAVMDPCPSQILIQGLYFHHHMRRHGKASWNSLT